MIYLIGSLRNTEIPIIANRLREAGHDVFEDWYSAGPNADDHWRDYERGRGRSYQEALDGLAACHVFDFDYAHLEAASIAILVLPAGRSCGMEFGWMCSRGKRGYILLDDPSRWDVMFRFAHKSGGKVFSDIDSLIKELAQ